MCLNQRIVQAASGYLPVRVHANLAKFSGHTSSLRCPWKDGVAPANGKGYHGTERERMTELDKTIEMLEAQFPPTSGAVFAHARDRVLSAGLSVLQSESGIIYEVFPDGHRREVKHIDPPTVVVLGSEVKIG